MKNRLIIILAGFIAGVSLGLSASLFVKVQETRDEVSQLKTQMDKQKSELTEMLKANQAALDKVNEQISATQKEIEELKK